MRNVACALASVGTMSPQYVFTPSTLDSMTNVGINVMWYGTMSMARNDQNMAFRPGNRFLAKA
jgi:hypothetical protein